MNKQAKQSKIMKIQVKFGKTAYFFEIEENQTIQDLKRKVENETGVLVKNQKWLGGTKLKNLDQDSSTVLECGLQDGLRVVLIERKLEEIESLNREADKRKVLLENRKIFQEKYQLKHLPLRNGASSTSMNETLYTFLNIEVLESFPDRDKADSILRKLKEDKGVQHIMNKYKWTVQYLKEIHPNQQSSILGYNQNKGQVIALRLRTDDLTGFRAFDMIKKVLMHELTHMEHSDHNDEFNSLNRRLNQEVVVGDWTRNGRLIADAFNSIEVSDNVYEEDVGEKEIHEEKVLGGESKVITDRMPIRELMYQSAMKRLSKEEQDITDQCGSRNHGN